MAETRRAFLPQFTIRWILGLTTAMAVVSLIIARALQGDAWAGGITMALITLVLTFIVYATMFALATLVGKVSASRRRRRQQLPPENQGGSTEDIAAQMSSMRVQSADPSVKLPLIIFVVAQALLVCGRVYAVSGGLTVLPQLQPGEINKTGLTLSVDTGWVDSCGYRPVRISVKSIAGPVKADRVLTLIFRPMQGFTSYASVEATQSVEISAGAASATATIAVPQLCPWAMYSLAVYEDGEYQKQLSLPDNVGWTSWSGTTKGDSASPAVLLLSGADKLTASFLVSASMELMFVAPENASSTIDPQIVSSAASSTSGPNGPARKSPVASFSELPTRWIDYSGFDVMLISLDKLSVLKRDHALQWKAICDWLHSGGNLIVYDAGKRWTDLAKVEQLVDFANQTDRPSAETDPVKRGWALPFDSLRSQAQLLGPEVTEPERTHVVPAGDASFITRPCGLGLLVAIPSEESISDTSYPWYWLFNTIGANRWQWSRRWGVSLYQNNDDFWNFLIPGVGLVPIFQFQVLITLFVVLLGPVSYYLLRSWGKLNLMVLTVPAGALVATGALLLYALIADGLSVRVRARSYTQLDQRSGEAACWARLSYYAGLAPSGGLKFADDTAVIPFQPQSMANDEQPVRVVDWRPLQSDKLNGPLEQNLVSGWLDSRTPTQFITARIRKCPEKLEIKPGAEGGAPQIVNHLGTAVKELLLVDENSKCFSASDLAVDAAITLKPAESQSVVMGRVIESLISAEPADADTIISGNHTPSFFGFNRDRHYAMGIKGYPPPQPVSNNPGILGRSLEEVRKSARDNSLPPKTYIAVVELSPEVQLGTPAAKPEESLHVIVGQW